MIRQLSKTEIHEFFDRGWIVIENLFSAGEVAQMSACLDRITEMAKQFRQTTMFRGAQFVVEGSRIDRVVWCGAAEPKLLDFGADLRLLTPVSQLLGSSSMSQLICQYHPKLPNDQVEFEWHQDSQHRGYGTSDWQDLNGRGSYVQTLTAVDEVSIDNGPVYFIPQSCQRGHLSLDQNPVERFFNTQDAVPLLMKPGSTAFFGPYSVHGSFPNESNKPRKVFINGYAYPGANQRQYPGDGSGRTLSI